MISTGYQLQIFGDLAGMGAEGLFFTTPMLSCRGPWGITKLFVFAHLHGLSQADSQAPCRLNQVAVQGHDP